MSQSNPEKTLKVLGSLAVTDVMDGFVAEFERASGFAVSGIYEPSKALMDRLNVGETGDVIMLLASALDELEKAGAIDPASRADLVTTGVAIAIRKGAPRPDVSSPEALKKTLLAAKSLVYTQRGASGIHFHTVIELLGLSEALATKSTRVDHPVRSGDLVARGEAEIGVQQWSELAAIPGIDIIGFLPGELASTITIAGAVFKASPNADAGKALIRFLKQPARAPAMEKLGLFLA